MLEVDSAFERHGWRGGSGSLIIEVERRVQELMCWEIRTLQICVYATPLEVDSGVKTLLSGQAIAGLNM